jgi:hypothetical protein
VGDLFNEIKNSAVGQGKKSRIAVILSTLSKEEQKDLLAALDDHSIPASNISRAMSKRGHKLAINVISRYRRGELVTKVDESR